MVTAEETGASKPEDTGTPEEVATGEELSEVDGTGSTTSGSTSLRPTAEGLTTEVAVTVLRTV